MELTAEQNLAVMFPENKRADLHSAAVTAAAGSGKTTLLVKRIIRILCESKEELKIPADKIAILTFTNNAADEFRKRMTAQIADAAKEHPEDRQYISEQLIKFRSAVISTINAFCLNILRENAESFGLPVNFSIIDEAKAAVIKAEAMDKVRDFFYSKEFEKICGKGASDLLFKTFSFKDDRALFENVDNIFEKTSTLVDPDTFLNNAVDSYSDVEKLEKAYINDYLEHIYLIIQKAGKNLQDYSRVISSDGRYELYSSIIDKDTAILDTLKAGYTYVKSMPTIDKMDEIIKSFASLSPATMPRTSDLTKEEKELVSKPRDKFKDCISTIKVLLIDKELLKDEINVQYMAVNAFVTLVKKFEAEFSACKLDAGYVDFNDCERKLLNKLKSDMDFCAEISKRYRCIVIDEFQDTSDLQYEIFRLISNDENNLFVVGDIKQSIYGFRGGNPRLMLGLIKDNDKFATLPLNKNFRSRKNVIKTVNTMFTGFMTEKHGDVDYNEETMLHFGAEYYPETGSNYTSELHILDYDNYKSDSNFNSAEEEANYTAALINRMINEDRFRLMGDDENNAARECTYGDFVILLRALTHAQKYKKALDRFNIPVDINGGDDYFATEEISLILNFLKVIDNPLLDEELLNVLMSPIYMMDVEEMGQAKLGVLGLDVDALPEDDRDEILTALRYSFKYKRLYTCLTHCAKAASEIAYGEKDPETGRQKTIEISRNVNRKCADFVSNIEAFRVFKSNSSIERLIRKIYDDTDFLSVIATYERSEQKLANIRLLLKYAADFENNGGGTLNEFIRYTNKVRENKKSFADAKTGASAKNAVKIMTFHKSKGLEMPIVILGQLGKGKNNMDTTGTVVFNRNLGVGMKYVDINRRYTYTPFGYTAIAHAEEQKQNGEELRLLYVAMTRAKEKLIMIGQCIHAKADSLTGGDFSPAETLTYGEDISWIISSILRNNTEDEDEPTNKDNLSAVKPLEVIRCNQLTDMGINQTSDYKDDTAEYDEATAKRIACAIKAEYANTAQTTARSKYTVTEIAHMIDEQLAGTNADDKSDLDIVYISKPSFLSKSQITGKMVGDSYHHAMEHFPLDRIAAGTTVRADFVKDILLELRDDNRLEEKEISVIKSERIAEFFNSELGKRMLASSRIEREYPIFAEVNASDIYVPGQTEKTIIQGRADMFFYEGDEIVLVDYKSDSAQNLKKEMEAYQKQLSIYKTILPILTGKQVKDIYIYSFSDGSEIKV